MDSTAGSARGVSTRLTAERWTHVVEHHDDLAGHYHDVLETISNPEVVYQGHGGEFLAISRGVGSRLVVVYREISSSDGFVITAFFTTRVKQIERRRLVWKSPSS